MHFRFDLWLAACVLRFGHADSRSFKDSLAWMALLLGSVALSVVSFLGVCVCVHELASTSPKGCERHVYVRLSGCLCAGCSSRGVYVILSSIE